MAAQSRGRLLTTFAVLFGLLAISNFLKVGSAGRPAPMEMGTAGFVFLGAKTSGMANAILGSLFGLILVAYVIGIWQLRRWAIPVGFTYASYVLINLITFLIRNPQDPNTRLFRFVPYALVALGVSWGAAILLYRRRSELT